MKKNSALLLMLVMIFPGIGYSLLFYPFTIDDAYITFAYSRNFSEFNVLMLRLDNSVEATSSYLWALLLGFASKFIFNPIIWSKIFGFIFWFATSLIVASLFINNKTTAKQIILICLAVVLPFSFGLWANYGMENALLGFLCFSLIFMLPKNEALHNIYLIVPLLILGIWSVRPEGFGYVLVLIFVEIIRRVFYRLKLSPIIISSAIGLVLALVYEIHGYLIYGTWLPDSATAKIAAPLVSKISSGLKYTLNSKMGILSAWLIIVSITFFIFDLLRKNISFRGDDKASVLLGVALSVSTVIFVLASGGDWMPASRFYSIVLPFCAAYIVWSILNKTKNYFLMTLFFFTLIASQASLGYSTLGFVAKLQKAEDSALQVMVDDLNQIALKSDILALSDIGRASYGFNGNIFDWWGLASREVTKKNEQLGKIGSQTIKDLDPHFLVIYANSEKNPRINNPPEDMAIYSFAMVNDKELMSRYCILGSYQFWDKRYHVLLAKHETWLRIVEMKLPIRNWVSEDCERMEY